MVDYNELRKKFRPKRPAAGETTAPMHRKSTKAAVKAIAREYELKQAALQGSGAPTLKRGPLFYAAAVFVLAIVGALVLSASKGRLSLGRQRIERSDLMARKAMDSLSVALGRYKFHVGEYPTTEEGLAVLAFRRPEEIRQIRRRHKGWDGPYVNHIVKDPWGRDYVYETRPEGGHPILYSRGPDGRMGTLDDVMPDQAAFEAAFRDTSWTNNWAPCELRGIVVAPDEATKRRVEADMKQYD
ncbi:MAG: type II secretion system protein GspG [Kiritimatiellia bacterium]